MIIFQSRYSHLQAKDAVYHTVRDGITEKIIPIGTSFTVSSLAKFLYLSRTPVEYALNRLTQEKVIKTAKSNGFFTYHLSFKEAKESNEYLLNLYLNAHLMAKNNIDFYYNNLLNDHISKLQQTDDLKEFLSLGHLFHVSIAESTANEFLITDFETESIRSSLVNLDYSNNEYSEKFMQEHVELDKALIDVINNGSPTDIFEQTQVHNKHIRHFIFERLLTF